MVKKANLKTFLDIMTMMSLGIYVIKLPQRIGYIKHLLYTKHIYAKRDLVLMMIIKSIINSEIIVTTQENIEELLIVFVI